jgi:putative nucleotidyltransferase with HDIG domain
MTITRSAKRMPIDRIVASLGELPTPPTVVSAVMGLTSNLNTEATKLSAALAADQALTAKVLRLSNSPFYGRSRTVGSLSEAVMILGFYTIRSLVVATSAYTMFSRGPRPDLVETLWRHSLGTATGARIIARRVGYPQIEEMFLAGLLHDIGILVLIKKAPEEYGAVIDQSNATGESRIELEESIWGFNHVELGRAVLEQWNFPSVLIDAVRCHHDPEMARDNPDFGDDGHRAMEIAHVIHFADVLARSQGYGFDSSLEFDLPALRSAESLGLTAPSIAEISEELIERMAEEEQLFK